MSAAGKELFVTALFKASEYETWLMGVKDKLRSSQLKAVSKDLMDALHQMKGFSFRNLRYVRQWYSFYIGRLHKLATACCQIEGFEGATNLKDCATAFGCECLWDALSFSMKVFDCLHKRYLTLRYVFDKSRPRPHVTRGYFFLWGCCD